VSLFHWLYFSTTSITFLSLICINNLYSMNKDSHFIFENYLMSNSERNNKAFGRHELANRTVRPVSKIVKDGHGKTITIGDFVSLIGEPEAMGEVREVLPNNVLVISHDGRHSEVDATDVELRPEGDNNPEEDAETWGIDGKLKEALQEVESAGFTKDHINPMEIAKLVLGDERNWGDKEKEYNPLLQALNHVIEAYYGKGLQDS